uniref:PBZ-type domain-containing protein n=1 Tax=Graphocephala atropunctata TaxID=36148 RepID=A0A1B6M6S4_9HEMI
MASNDETCDYKDDPRTPCKYGTKCYQTNKLHKKKYKHPPLVEVKTTSPEIPNKKRKLDTDDQTIFIATTNNKERKDVSSPLQKPSEMKPEGEIDSSVKYTPLKDKVRTSEARKVELKSNLKELIKQLFLMEMPEDFFSFWEMCETMNKNDPTSALKAIKLKLVGPFDVLAGKVTDVYEEDLPDFLKHWRYYYDPPEFQTVICSEDSRCYHMGYYRDDPNEIPVFVASNVLNSKNPEKNGDLKIVGQNLFAALNSYLEELKTDPFSRMKIPQFQKTLTSWAKEKGFNLDKNSKEMDSRSRKVVAKTFHGAGIVVPVDKKNDVGYRELAASNTMIKKMLKGLVDSKSEEERAKFWEQLQPVITFANIANDECDFGTSLELGLDLFTYGSPLLHRSARQLLTTAYNLLGRNQFAQIVEVHLDDRRKGGNLSIL